MRSDMIVIGGQKYPVKGLSVSQSIMEDLLAAEANRGADNKTKVNVRMRRMAVSLQNGKAFLPDLKSPVDENGKHRGQIGTADLPIEKVVELLDTDLWDSAKEFYDAEIVVMGLTGFGTPNSKESAAGAGESPAAE